MPYSIIGGDSLKAYHLKSVILGDQLGLTPADGLQVDDFRSISRPELHRQAVEDAMQKIAAAGPVGTALANLANDTNLQIVCWPGLPGEFLCPEEVAGIPTSDDWGDWAWGTCDVPTIMWDPYKQFAYFTRVGRTVSADDQATYGRMLGEFAPGYTQMLSRGPAVKYPAPRTWDATGVQTVEAATKQDERSGVSTMKPAVMPAWIVLAHELGHYNHWWHERSWFVGALQARQINVIEARNLTDHEQPILRSAGLPERYLYQDFAGGSNSTADHNMASEALVTGIPKGVADVKATLDMRVRSLKDAKPKGGGHNAELAALGSKTHCPSCGLAGASNVHRMTCGK